MKRVSLMSCLILASVLAFAQNSSAIRGSVQNSQQQAIEAATVSILENGTNKLIKIGTTNKDGLFEVGQLPATTILIQITAVGYNPYNSEAHTLKEESTLELPLIQLSVAGKSMDAVTVTARKPMVEVKADKTVVNVDAFISNAGGTALDVLEKSPGVTVDRDGILSLKGKQGVIVLIDGKQTYLSGQDLANLLRNMPSNQLESVEIMTQPSAKFDAAGNSGIINIRTKKGRQNGLNGSVSVG
ncbi:MAG TPA: TonB-dependent receptor, partial [Flavihumibacter sp.]